MLENQKHTTMKQQLLRILLAAPLMGATFAVAQTNTDSPAKPQQAAIRGGVTLVTAVSLASTNSATATSSNTPAIASASAGKTNAQVLAESAVTTPQTRARPQPPLNLRIVPSQ